MAAWEAILSTDILIQRMMKDVFIIWFLLLSVCLFVFLYRKAVKSYRDAKENSLEELERWKEEKLQEYLTKKRHEEESNQDKQSNNE